jgi:hypothetical protein
LLASLAVLTHAPPHAVRPTPHPDWQAPPEQPEPAEHAWPHAPQFDALVERLTQLPLQYAAPSGQVTVMPLLPPQPSASASAPTSNVRFMCPPVRRGQRDRTGPADLDSRTPRCPSIESRGDTTLTFVIRFAAANLIHHQ